jgi:hypothetical protein
MKTWYLSVIIAVLALASLAAAVVLQLTGNDATHAWEGFALLVAFLVGVHVPSPTQSG